MMLMLLLLFIFSVVATVVFVVVDIDAGVDSVRADAIVDDGVCVCVCVWGGCDVSARSFVCAMKIRGSSFPPKPGFFSNIISLSLLSKEKSQIDRDGSLL